MKKLYLNLLNRPLTKLEAPGEDRLIAQMQPGFVMDFVAARCEAVLTEILGQVSYGEILAVDIYCELTPCAFAALVFFNEALPILPQVYVEGDKGSFLALWTFAAAGLDFKMRTTDDHVAQSHEKGDLVL